MASFKERMSSLIGIEEFSTSKNDRFVRVTEDGEEKALVTAVTVIKDKKTGVFYLQSFEGHITPLLDSDGKVMVDRN